MEKWEKEDDIDNGRLITFIIIREKCLKCINKNAQNSIITTELVAFSN